MGKQPPALYRAASRPFTPPWRRSCTDDRIKDGLSLVAGAHDCDCRLSVNSRKASSHVTLQTRDFDVQKKRIFAEFGGTLGVPHNGATSKSRLADSWPDGAFAKSKAVHPQSHLTGGRHLRQHHQEATSRLRSASSPIFPDRRFSYAPQQRKSGRHRVQDTYAQDT